MLGLPCRPSRSRRGPRRSAGYWQRRWPPAPAAEQQEGRPSIPRLDRRSALRCGCRCLWQGANLWGPSIDFPSQREPFAWQPAPLELVKRRGSGRCRGGPQSRHRNPAPRGIPCPARPSPRGWSAVARCCHPGRHIRSPVRRPDRRKGASCCPRGADQPRPRACRQRG